MAGVIEDGAIEIEPVHRFANGPVERQGHLRWDLERLWGEVQDGLARLAARHPQVESIGIDSWGVDYGLLDADGELLADPIAHRDTRTDPIIDAVHELIPPEDLFGINGLQFLPFTTLYQLAVEQQALHWGRVAHVVLIPDLLAYRLTGALRTERTNASTTGLLDVQTGEWSDHLLDRLGLAVDLLPPLESAGGVRGRVRAGMCRQLGFAETTVVTTVGSHDTASAVVGIPAVGSDHAYAISGTWSLVGLELGGPILTREARAANFTNELGVGGSIRFLRNVGGLWLLQECMRTWRAMGEESDLETLLAAAAAESGDGPTIDVDDPVFIPPGDMPERIAAVVGRSAGSVAQITRGIIESLAAAYVRTVEQGSSLAGRPVRRIHLVGGGSQNALLCQRTADRSGLAVLAGPVEATALGNVLVQARALGMDVDPMAGSVGVRRYDP